MSATSAKIRLRAMVVATVVAAAGMMAIPVHAADLCNNGNNQGTLNRPARNFTPRHFGSSARITKIMTYHWNNGRGATPGTVALRNRQTGEKFGPFPVTGSPSQGPRRNVYWTAQPNITVPAGDYELIDSDVATWAWNSASQGNGIVVVSGEFTSGAATRESPVASNSAKPPCPNCGNVVTKSRMPLQRLFRAAANKMPPFNPLECDTARSAVARKLFERTYQATSLPQSYSACRADYDNNIANINMQMTMERDYLSCLRKETDKNKTSLEAVEKLSKLLAAGSLRLQELTQNKAILEQGAAAARKKCEIAVDALNPKNKPSTAEKLDRNTPSTANTLDRGTPPTAKTLDPSTPSTAKTSDGTYLGAVVYTGIMRGNSGKEILKLTVAGSNVSGSTKYTSPPAIGMVIDTKISGQVSSNGDITANFTSTNHYRNGTTAPGPPGKMNGRIIGQVASGSVTFDRKELSQPPATGTWRAARQ